MGTFYLFLGISSIYIFIKNKNGLFPVVLYAFLVANHFNYLSFLIIFLTIISEESISHQIWFLIKLTLFVAFFLAISFLLVGNKVNL
jgi:hypothetical protein